MESSFSTPTSDQFSQSSSSLNSTPGSGESYLSSSLNYTNSSPMASEQNGSVTGNPVRGRGANLVATSMMTTPTTGGGARVAQHRDSYGAACGQRMPSSGYYQDNGQMRMQQPDRQMGSNMGSNMGHNGGLGAFENFTTPLQQQLMDIVRTMDNSSQEHYNRSPIYPPQYSDDMSNRRGFRARNFGKRRAGRSPFFTGLDTDGQSVLDNGSAATDNGERFSRKVFVGGLPPDIDEEEITASFRRFGALVVDWPHKAESKSYFPPKGYAFLLFQDEASVQALIDACINEENKLYLCVSSPTIKDKPVQIRPWRLSDADFVLDATMPLDPRKTVFVGGVPRPLKAFELAMIMDRLYGGVCYAGIDTDPELKYPKGAGRVAFSNQQSYIAAISARFVQLQHQDIEKRVEVKPYVLDDQICDECQGARCNGKFAPFFCANVTCLQYYCEQCWSAIHSRPGREFHKPLVKEGTDRPRAVPFRCQWRLPM
ncbi:Cytoplasmic polyadenylation element-binding protein 4 [Halotydeus destructor]|nr:Cytoplasmic polyadenylation element-binding protein 4 [Halotydeus destructor]